MQKFNILNCASIPVFPWQKLKGFPLKNCKGTNPTIGSNMEMIHRLEEFQVDSTWKLRLVRVPYWASILNVIQQYHCATYWSGQYHS